MNRTVLVELTALALAFTAGCSSLNVIKELHAFDNTATVDVQAGDDSSGKHLQSAICDFDGFSIANRKSQIENDDG